ncbi:glycoside hydrolase family 127 protein [Pelagicoccus sp. SDUM812002]|uniref:glycoside hydrolase family 127 protein n=1 Tax=Pelagicoccus sp. SDUM812002 TaxID=3041266 RepID=UPI00280CB900|nr:glycoside hydrolase family 127 protein [Pelagicoccus sp. SDUM812002]MDQ8188152.1 glycoside hydrolase family 127 protein [Pelagicoccus sp. SDUM812002]
MRNLVIALTLAAVNAASLPSAELFHPSDVTIADGPFRDSIAADIDYVLAHDPDRLLAPFLIAADLEPKAPKYGNWESSGLDGHSAGHFLSAYATLSLQSDNPLLAERLNYMLDELKRCQDAIGTGYLGGVPNSQEFIAELQAGKIQADRFSLNGAWVPWYNLHKTYAGLKDAWLVANSEQARDMLLDLTDWTYQATSKLTEEQLQQMLYTEHGGMNEIFAEMYQKLGDKRYLELAYRFTHHELLDPLLEGEDKLTGFHANTQIPKVIGFQRTALAADDEKLHKASEFFWDTVVNHRSVTIGGNSVREHFHPADDFRSMLESREGPETCNTHNMLRLTTLLFQSEPSAEFTDYYERALYNHILSAQHPETGGLVYFTPMRPRHYRVYSVPEDAFWCCVGSGIENPGRYSEFVYAKQDDTLFVNLFLASSLDWQERGLRISQTTDFPATESSTIKIESAPKKKFTLKIRRPSWATDAYNVTLNGKPVKAPVDDFGYASVTRKWKAGDTLDIALPMQVRAEQLPDGSPFYSFLYGPIVLAQKVAEGETPGLFAGSGRMEHVAPGAYLPLDQAPMLVGEPSDLAARLKPVDGKSLRFELTGDVRPQPEEPIILEPFNQIHESRYSTYWQSVDADHYASIQEELAKKEAIELALAARTVDSIAPGEQQSEVEHDYRGEGARSGAILGQRFRETTQWFEYDLRAPGNEPLALAIKYLGSEWGKGCKILVNGTEIGTLELSAQLPDAFTEISFDIPQELTAERDDLTVRIEAIDERTTPMVFGIALRLVED